MFRITGSSDDARLEPVLCGHPEIAVTPLDEGREEPTIGRVAPAEPAPLFMPGAGSGREQGAGAHGWMDAGRSLSSGPPAAAAGGQDDGPRPPDADARNLPVKERRWSRLRGPVGSLLLHLLPLLLLLEWQTPPPAETEPVTVQLVVEPPPPPPVPEAKPPPPQPQPKPVPPPPRGRLASEDLGDPQAKEVDRPKGDAPKAADTPAPTEAPPTETKPAEKPQQTAAVVPPPLPPAKPDAPKPDPVPKPPPKPSPAAHQTPRRVEEPANLAPRRARFPGPAATRDEYLAYMHGLIRQHYGLLPPAMLGDRRGMTVIEFVVLDDGKIALLKVRRSSGYPDIDQRIEEMIEAVGRFPPLPQWFQGLAMPFEFGFPFPEALRE